MNIKEIKVGKWYNVPFKVVEIKSGDIHMENGGIKAVCQPSELSEITSVERTERLWNGMCDILFDDNGQKYAADLSKAMRNHIKSITPDNENVTKNTETAPKYDPCRKFRKGDKVKAVLRHGRIPNDGVPKDVILEVIADERDGIVKVLHKMGVILEIFNVYALYLELVTPVEELELYYVERQGEKTGGLCYTVRKHGGHVESTFYFGECRSRAEQQAKAAAEAERDRLNAEWRKEQNDG